MAYIKKNPHEGQTLQKSFTFLSMEIHICQITITNMQFKYFKKLANFIKNLATNRHFSYFQ